MKTDMKAVLMKMRNDYEQKLRAANNACRERQPGFTIRTHPADREDNPEIFSVNVIRVKHLEECIVNVDQALKKLSNGEFGYCEGCGNKIPLRRLKVKPDARLCVFCQIENEKR